MGAVGMLLKKDVCGCDAGRGGGQKSREAVKLAVRNVVPLLI